MDLDNDRVTDAGLVHLKGLTQLRRLDLRLTSITDTHSLKHLHQLNDLALYFTRVDDAGLASIKGLSRLQVLDISRTLVTDAGLECIGG